MVLKVTTIEVVQDNHQGGSGKVVENEMNVEVNDNTTLQEAFKKVLDKTKEYSINSSVWGGNGMNYCDIKKIELIPFIKEDQ